MIFRDLPAAANAKRLVMLQQSADGDLAAESYYYVQQYRQQTKLFSGAAAFETGVPFNVTFPGALSAKPRRMIGQLVSPDYFEVLGVRAQRGRLLSPSLDKTGDGTAVVISDRFWRVHLHSSPDALGQLLRLNGQLATIVGITPQDFNGALGVMPAELFVPITAPPSVAPELADDVLHRRNAKEFLPILCLAPGVTIGSAEAALDAIRRNLDAQNVNSATPADRGRSITLIPAGTNAPIPRKIKPALIGFFIALMGLLLALVCTNLANMLMARAANRRKEVAIRLSLGASRFRLVRQMITEGMVLSLLGGAAGSALTYGLMMLDAHFAPPMPVPVQVNYLEWRAVVFAFGVAIMCGVAFSLAPALQATRTNLTPALKEGSALHLPGYRRFGLRNLLMTSQVAASLVLVLMTGFLVIGIAKSGRIETAFDPHTMYLLAADPVRDGYSAQKAQDFFQKLPERLRALGAVKSVALAAQPPFDSEGEPSPLAAEDSSGSSRIEQPIVDETVGPGYFAALGEPLLAGREFDQHDEQTAANESPGSLVPAVLSERAQRKLFGTQNGIGKRLADDRRSYQVVGVVPDKNDVEGFSQPTMYLPLTARNFARPGSTGITILVRSSAGADALSGIRKEIAFADPDVNLFHVETLAAYFDRSRSAWRFSIQSWGAIGVFGLILAAIGLAGVTGYAVAQRRKEIAIRTALGATKAQLLRLVLREGAALVAAGTLIGLLGAIALARIVAALMHVFVDALRLGTNDPLLLIGAPLLLAFVAMIACYIPARRTAKIDPLMALREE